MATSNTPGDYLSLWSCSSGSSLSDVTDPATAAVPLAARDTAPTVPFMAKTPTSTVVDTTASATEITVQPCNRGKTIKQRAARGLFIRERQQSRKGRHYIALKSGSQSVFSVLVLPQLQTTDYAATTECYEGWDEAKESDMATSFAMNEPVL